MADKNDHKNSETEKRIEDLFHDLLRVETGEGNVLRYVCTHGSFSADQKSSHVWKYFFLAHSIPYCFVCFL